MDKKIAFNKKLFVVGTISVLIGLVLGWLVITSTHNFYKQVQNNWSEIQFAYDHPAMVRAMREEYASKSAQLEEGFLRRNKDEQPNNEQQLLGEIKNQLQTLK